MGTRSLLIERRAFLMDYRALLIRYPRVFLGDIYWSDCRALLMEPRALLIENRAVLMERLLAFWYRFL